MTDIIRQIFHSVPEAHRRVLSLSFIAFGLTMMAVSLKNVMDVFYPPNLRLHNIRHKYFRSSVSGFTMRYITADEIEAYGMYCATCGKFTEHSLHTPLSKSLSQSSAEIYFTRLLWVNMPRRNPSRYRYSDAFKAIKTDSQFLTEVNAKLNKEGFAKYGDLDNQFEKHTVPYDAVRNTKKYD